VKKGFIPLTPAILCQDLASKVSQINKNKPGSFINDLRKIEKSLPVYISSVHKTKVNYLKNFDISELTYIESILSKTFFLDE